MNKIPVMKIIEEVDVFLNRNQEQKAKELLENWCDKAKLINDYQGELSLLNELMGLNRKLGNSEHGILAINRGFYLIGLHKLENEIGAATIYLNGATALKSFGNAKESIKFYQKAEQIYANKGVIDGRLGALYNNMALAYADVNDKIVAKKLFEKALIVVKNVGNGVLEEAMTYLNIADLLDVTLVENQNEIDRLINQSYACLMNESIEKNGYYAFVCSKCAPSFGYYGYFIMKNNLEKVAEDIYARNRNS